MVAVATDAYWVSATSRMYILAAITASNESLSGLPVEMAFVRNTDSDEPDTPDEIDWLPAQWLGNQARCLIGPGGEITLEPKSRYWLWSRVTTPFEMPELLCGQIITY